jgi:hypothetical protein
VIGQSASEPCGPVPGPVSSCLRGRHRGRSAGHGGVCRQNLRHVPDDEINLPIREHRRQRQE